jgi:hypothetical protein
VPKWLPRSKSKGSSTEPYIGIDSIDDARPLGREGRLFDLVILSLFLHSGGSVHEMTQAFIEKGPSIAEALFVFPLTLDKKRDVLVATGLEGIVEQRLENAMNAFQEDLTAIELDLPFNHFRRKVLEQEHFIRVRVGRGHERNCSAHDDGCADLKYARAIAQQAED